MRANTSLQFAQWLGETHPEVYEALFAHAVASGHAGQAMALSGLGDVASDFDLSDFTPTLSDVSVDQDNLDYVVASAYGDAVDALPGDLSVTGTTSQPISSSGGVTGSANSVGNWLTSPSGLTAIANLGTAVLNTVATTQVAKTQMAVINAQAQRAANNQSPLPITYVTGANGQQVPVYVTGTSAGTPSVLTGSPTVQLPDGSTGVVLNNSSLNSVLGNSLPWLLLAAGVLVALMAGTS